VIFAVLDLRVAEVVLKRRFKLLSFFTIIAVNAYMLERSWVHCELLSSVSPSVCLVLTYAMTEVLQLPVRSLGGADPHLSACLTGAKLMFCSVKINSLAWRPHWLCTASRRQAINSSVALQLHQSPDHGP